MSRRGNDSNTYLDDMDTLEMVADLLDQGILLPQTYAAVTQIVRQALDCEGVAIYLATDQNHPITLMGSAGRIPPQTGAILMADGFDIPYTLDDSSLFATPLRVQGSVLGALVAVGVEPYPPDMHHRRLVRFVADRLAAAVHIGRLLMQTEREVRRREALSDIIEAMSAELDFDALFKRINESLVSLFLAATATIGLLNPDNRSYNVRAAHNNAATVGRSYTVGEGSTRAVLLENKAYSTGLLDELSRPVQQAYMSVPVLWQERPIGFLQVVAHDAAETYSLDDVRMLQLLARHAAVAIENARLYERSREVATLEERQKLARELHDSVTQALFSTTLTTKAATILLEKGDTARTATKLAEIRTLTQDALAEMRALIFELRPNALREEGLIAALRKHAAALQGRQGLPVAMWVESNGVQVAGDDEARLPRLQPEAEEAFYRIAQEAMHNIVKHANATRVSVSHSVSPKHFGLCISDDGVGFDPARVLPGHMGQQTMRQRATAIGATLSVESAPGNGTHVRLNLSR